MGCFVYQEVRRSFARMSFRTIGRVYRIRQVELVLQYNHRNRATRGLTVAHQYCESAWNTGFRATERLDSDVVYNAIIQFGHITSFARL